MKVTKSLIEAFKPDGDHLRTNVQLFRLDQRRLAFWVGLIAVFMPFIMFFSQYFGVVMRESISHYYYVPFLGGIFVLSLAFIATFLIAFRGVSKWQSRLATAAGWLAFGIAFFPTNEWGFNLDKYADQKSLLFIKIAQSDINPAVLIEHNNLKNAFALSNNSGTLHFLFAALFFVLLAIYSLFIFTQSEDGVSKINGQLTPIKKLRNKIYYASGSLIIFCILLIASNLLPNLWGFFWNDYHLTFWFESLALFAFGIAWLVNGRFWGMALNDN